MGAVTADENVMYRLCRLLRNDTVFMPLVAPPQGLRVKSPT